MKSIGDIMPRLTSEINQNHIYYYDNRESCKVELPNIDIHAIFNAELLNYNGAKHCDLIFMGSDETSDCAYLIELRDINTLDGEKIEERISPDLISKKAEGSLLVLEREIFKLYPNFKLKDGSIKVVFVMIIGTSAIEYLAKTAGLFKRIQDRFLHLAKAGMDEGRIQICGSSVYHDDERSFELI